MGSGSSSSSGGIVCGVGGSSSSSSGGGATNGLQGTLTYIPPADFFACSEETEWGCNCSDFLANYTGTSTTAPFSCASSAGNIPPGGAGLDETALVMASFLPGSSNAYSKYAETFTDQVFFNNLNYAEEDFNVGLTDQKGAPIKANGNLLVVDFAFFIEGSIMLNAGDTPGNYEFATITDDGSIMYLDPAGGTNYQTWINADGTHSNELACASKTVALQVGKPVSFKLNYFEGPAYYMALQLLWRKLPNTTIPTTDPTSNLCGFVADNGCYDAASATSAGNATDTKDKSCVKNGTTASLYTLYNDGWSPVPTANLYLPGNGTVTNPCNGSSSSSSSSGGSD